MDSYDFKSLSLALYGKEIIVSIEKGSNSEAVFKSQIHGILVGRIWGDRLIAGSVKETVIAITLSTSAGEFEIPCKDISGLEEAVNFPKDLLSSL